MLERDFCQLYEDHYALVHGYLRRRLASEEAARDLTAETFLVAWRRLADPPEHPVAWLLTVARHQLTNSHRAAAQERRLMTRVGSRADRPPPDAADDGLALDGPVGDALRQLTSADRDVVLLVAWEDLDGEGLARVLGCSPGAARVRLHRARQRLQRLLSAPPPERPTACSPATTHLER